MMNGSKRKLVFLFIIITVALLLLLEINLSSSPQKKGELANNAELFSLLNTTPTPYPLPEQTYNTSPSVTTLLRQLFGKKNVITDPSLIVQKSQKRFENDKFDLYVEDDQLIIDSLWWQQESEKVYEYVSQKVEEKLDKKIIVVIAKPLKESCGPRGQAFLKGEQLILIYADNDTSREQLLGTLAHEVGHILNNHKYEKLTDVALSEGMATWAAGDYWKAWKGVDFDSSVIEMVKKNTYLPLVQNYDLEKAYNKNNPACIANRDELLTEFASFIDYLISEYGVDKLARLYEIRQPETLNNQRIIYPPNYKEVYGLELNQLEYNWLNKILETNQ